MDKTSVLALLVLGACPKKEERLPEFEVNYSVEARELMDADSRYLVSWELRNYDISGWRRADLPQRVRFSILHLREGIGYEEAQDETVRQGYRPANFDELLSYIRQSPEAGRDFRIFALATIWKDEEHYQYFPYFYQSGVVSGIGLHYIRYAFSSDARFLSIQTLDNY